MGHLIRIANLVVQEFEKNATLNAFVNENLAKETLTAWNNFIKGPLANINKTQQIILVSNFSSIFHC